ncbi:hypothetical protein CMV_020285 [Castanea mollissima]|uniref:SWIM-type domain-containing protein n=1 Tax=Castanea mollissima TaxID=60419 RepID=A0A8J4VFX7_9ROSI|nr:hypothetical protein CMV_020285 [Castanea mollissima]
MTKFKSSITEKNTAKTWKKGDLVYYKQVGMNLDEGLVQIKTDPDVLKMVDCHKGVESVVLYTVSQEIDSDCIPFTLNLPESVIIGGSKRKGKEKCVANAAGFNRPKLQIKGGKNKSTGSNRKGKEKVRDDVVPLGYDADGDLDVDWHENISEDEYDSLNESEEEEEFDVENSRAYKDPFWGEVLSGDEDIFEPIGKENDPKKVLYLTHGEQMGKDCGSDIGKSDELISPKPTSEEDNCNTNKNPEFNEIDMACPGLVKGLKFGDVATFRAVVREANLIKGKDLRFVKNNKDKVIVRCKAEGCKYRVYGSQVTDEMTFQIKTLNPTHTCTRACKNSACTSRWISKRYVQKFRYDLNYATAGLQKEIKDKFHVNVGRMQVYRARKSAEKDLGLVEQHGWAFISHRQKGLIQRFDVVCPMANHRSCVRHLYANYRDKGHKGKHLRTSYPSMWSRSYFTDYSKSDLLVNNLSESFNLYILDARDKPIVTMIEKIRRKLMRRFQLKREGMSKLTGKICPKIQAKLDNEGLKYSDYVSIYAGNGLFEVECRHQRFVVNLSKRKCGCRKWDLTGIPCQHAISAILFDGSVPEDYWRRTSIDHLEPPKDKIQHGRPKIKRKRHPSEPKNPYKLSKAGTIIKCYECKKVGHNSKTCPSKKDKGTMFTNVKKTPTTNKKQAVGGVRATIASAVDSRARGVRIAAASDVDSRAGGSRTVASSAIDSRTVAASSTGVRTSTAPLTIYGGDANSECVVVPTLEKAIQRMQDKKKKKPWV